MATGDWDQEDGFLGYFCVFVQHGLLILRDVHSVDPHEGWDGGSTVHAGADSIYLRVQSSVDGPVAVDVFADDSEDLILEGGTIFEGTISSRHGEFVLADPNDWISMKVITDDPGLARIRISGDEISMPTELRIQIW